MTDEEAERRITLAQVSTALSFSHQEVARLRKVLAKAEERNHRLMDQFRYLMKIREDADV